MGAICKGMDKHGLMHDVSSFSAGIFQLALTVTWCKAIHLETCIQANRKLWPRPAGVVRQDTSRLFINDKFELFDVGSGTGRPRMLTERSYDCL